MIASPNDVIEERKTSRDVIYEWNSIHSKNRRILLNPIGWDINAYPETGHHPQAILNKQLLNEADILIAILWNRIGTSTKDFKSGTIEEITKHVNSGKPALLYFSNAEVSLKNVDMEQYNKLKEYKESIKSTSYYNEYNSITEFKSNLSKHLQLIVNNNLKGFTDDISHVSNHKDITENNYSETKRNAIDFVERITEFRRNKNYLGFYINNLGNYRSNKLNRFFEAANLISIKSSTDSESFIQIRPGFHNLSDTDIKYLLDDIRNGEYDYCL
jgi:asparagine N-glycosylation enzyme membrane subunit Stt3